MTLIKTPDQQVKESTSTFFDLPICWPSRLLEMTSTCAGEALQAAVRCITQMCTAVLQLSSRSSDEQCDIRERERREPRGEPGVG